MPLNRWVRFAAGVLVLTACEQDAHVMAGPVVDELWMGPEVIATDPEMTSLAEVAVDPLLLEISAMVPLSNDKGAASALQTFSAELFNQPAPSFLLLEHSLGSAYGVPDLTLEPDAEVATEVLDLYRDWAAQTLFGVDRDALAPFIQPGS
ncbi:MAG: hypothetical protein OEN56_01600 [Gemmatimonadota bacterium]|nr:hypothetical protein [Gemmatimonadota bacterium]